jgi:NAD(P)-dependent dehydrogenase (short-subunit alcohol dehydrogenase family)
MHNRTVLLTGATSGIGRVMAHSLAGMGATLVLACRNDAQAQTLCTELAAAGNPHVAALQLDLASLASIRRFTATFAARYHALHVLINNAGTFCLRREETVDGFERTIGVNYLGPFLLTSELAPLLAATPGARIVNVGSAAYRYGRLDLADLQFTRRYAGFPAYAASKLAVQLWTHALAERLRPAGVTANVAHPGHVATGIWRLWPRPTWYQQLFMKLITAFMNSPEAGAQTPLYLATSPDVAGITGTYFAKQRPQAVRGQAADRALQQALWQAAEQLTGAHWSLAAAP